MDTTQDTRMPLTSYNLVAERINALREMFPEVFTEGAIDYAKLKQALGEFIDDSPERYGLSWAGKFEAIRAVQSLSSGTLVPRKKESVNFDTTENLFIEGDNLEVLKLLQKSYYGKIKMIYIDPPYNTGNEFIYPDNYREGLDGYLRYSGQVSNEGLKLETNTETSGRFHSKWLNMIYPRLFLAKNLLRDDGVIFISIDDNEACNLKKVCDEIFGEENFAAQLVWEKGRKNDSKLFSIGHDYIIVYVKSKAHLMEKGTKWREAKPGADDVQKEYLRLKKKYADDTLLIEKGIRLFYAGLPKSHPAKKLTRYSNVDKRGVWRDDNMSWPGGGGPTYTVLHPVTKQSCKVPEGGWRYSTAEKMQDMIDAGRVIFRSDHTEPPIKKTYLVRESEDDERAEEWDDDAGIQVASTYFYRSALQASNLMQSLFGFKIFDNPKDHEVLARWISYVGSDEKEDIILDFFAGSGSTAQAVLELNKADKGNRKFIVVQLPEPTGNDDLPTIADIGKERIRRVIKKMNDEDNGKLDLYNSSEQDRGFKVFKLTSSNFKLWNADEAPKDADALAEQLKLYADHIVPKRSQDDILYELLLKAGLPLTANIDKIEVHDQKIFSVADGQLLICLEDEVTQETLRGMIELKPEMVLCMDNAFKGNDQLKTNIVLEMESHEIKFHTV